MCAQCDFSKHSGTFCFGNTHPLIVTLYLLWRSMKVLKKKKKRNAREWEEGGSGRKEEGGRGRGNEGEKEGGGRVRERMERKRLNTVQL